MDKEIDKAYGEADRATARDSLEILQELLTEQTANINRLTDTIAVLASAIEQRPTKRQTFKYLGGFIAVIIIFLAGTFYTSQENHKVVNRIDDCLVEGGQCRTETDARTAEAVKLIVLSNKCESEQAIVRAYETANLPTYSLSPECEAYFEQQALGQ